MNTAKFKKLVLEYKNIVYSQALYWTGNRHDAADITQDVLIKLWNNIDEIKLPSVKSWLLKVTRNCCIDLGRKKKERYFSELNDDNEEDPVSRISSSDETDPEQRLDKAEARKRIIDAITRLPEKIRTALILRYIQGEAYEVIAETVGCPVNSIKVYLHRGRKMLTQTLKETKQG